MKKRSVSVFSGKGFYIVLALSVAMVGAACYFAYTQTSDSMDGSLDHITASSETQDSEREAANIITNITKAAPVHTTQTVTTRTTTASTTAQQVIQPVTTTAAEEECTAEQPASVFTMPIDGEVIGEFSGGELIRSETTGAWQTHNGVDIKAAPGDTVVAADDGTVKAVENDPLWGVTVTIDHGNGIVTKYCSLNSGVTVQAGQKVSGGEEIGAVGDTADIESGIQSHLHFEVIKNGSYTDPKELF